MTPGIAPSAPATATMASAAARVFSSPSSRCRPATPTSATSTADPPNTCAVTRASRATGRSDVPAVTTATVRCGCGVGPTATVPATSSSHAPGKAPWHSARVAPSHRVASTARSGCAFDKPRNDATVCSGVLCSASTTSGSPVRRRRSMSSRMSLPGRVIWLSCHNRPVGSDQAVSGAELLAWFRRCASVRVAFSGGVDSSLVLAAATRALGPAHVEAVTAVSESLPSGMLTAARQLADSLGVSHTELATRELDNPGYAANGADGCYFCKATLIDSVASLGDGALLVTGTNADDVRAGWRPGIRAAAERGAGTPLADTGMTKADVRRLSRSWGLPTADRPASPCLSSRIAYGVPITPRRLARVDAAEQAVRAVIGRAGLDIHDLRVRDLGDAVRLEVDASVVPAVRQLEAVGRAISAAGFGAAAVEVTPFRSGSMND